jgi:hypothetical protein
MAGFSGTVLWAVAYSYRSGNYHSTVTFDSAQNLYIGGQSNGTAVFGSHSLTATSNAFAFFFGSLNGTNGQSRWLVSTGSSGTPNANFGSVQSAGYLKKANRVVFSGYVSRSGTSVLSFLLVAAGFLHVFLQSLSFVSLWILFSFLAVFLQVLTSVA